MKRAVSEAALVGTVVWERVGGWLLFLGAAAFVIGCAYVGAR